ncbi:hypothetical protein DXX92_00115 [Thalassotalea euphylliae]|uniref:Uncharacterized protein n=1 Tax=Thalassotalea euphylliae TaxID=1655234 RepID=A0A3E0UBD3_9GAMM|nr:hypothetical protein DXX92_00115 [Thalassotalea euphylliae]
MLLDCRQYYRGKVCSGIILWSNTDAIRYNFFALSCDFTQALQSAFISPLQAFAYIIASHIHSGLSQA